MEQRLNWLILGAGAIGTYIGGSLILHGQKVTFLELAPAASEIAKRGLRLNIHGQEHRILHPEVYSSLPAVLSNTSYDISIIALKSYDTHIALETIRQHSEEFPPVLCLQNGVENEPLLEQVLGKNKVIAGTVTSAISRRGAGDILLERSRGIGVAAGHPLSAEIQSKLSSAGLNARLFSPPASMKWSKLLTNLLANASSAILDMAPSEILAHPGLYTMEITQLREAIAVCQAQKIKIVDLPGTPVRLFAWAVKQLPPGLSRIFVTRVAGRGRGNKMPSFHIDLHSGRGQSEVDYLNGAVIRFGERLGVPTPVNNWLNQTLLNLIHGELPLDEYAHQTGKFLDQVSIVK